MQNKTIHAWQVICHGFIISIFQLTIQQLSITNDEYIWCISKPQGVFEFPISFSPPPPPTVYHNCMW